MSHTPGPWVDSVSLDGLVGSDGDRVIVWGLAIGHGPRTPKSEANARLLKCAPEMLDALEEAADMLDVAEFPEGAGTVQKVRAVISKARGEPC